MPVRKPAVVRNSAAKRRKKRSVPTTEVVEHSDYDVHVHMHSFGRKILWTLIGIFVVYGIVLVGTLIRNNIKQYEHIGQANEQVRTITIESEGNIRAVPDIAKVNMGAQTVAQTVAESQEANTELVDSLVLRLKQLGIDRADIQTSGYNIFPRYNYDEEEGQVLEGYEVNQQLTIKIRNLNKIQDVFALAGEVGANNVEGLTFTIDDPDIYYDDARNEAVKKLNEKTETLAQTLGVSFLRIVEYDEFEGGLPRKGAVPLERAIPQGGSIEEGSMDIRLGIRVVFEIE